MMLSNTGYSTKKAISKKCCFKKKVQEEIEKFIWMSRMYAVEMRLSQQLRDMSTMRFQIQLSTPLHISEWGGKNHFSGALFSWALF